MRFLGRGGAGILRPQTSRRSASQPDLEHHAAVLLLQEFLRTHLQYQGSGCGPALCIKLRYPGEQENYADQRCHPPARACRAESDGYRPGCQGPGAGSKGSHSPLPPSFPKLECAPNSTSRHCDPVAAGPALTSGGPEPSNLPPNDECPDQRARQGEDTFRELHPGCPRQELVPQTDFIGSFDFRLSLDLAPSPAKLTAALGLHLPIIF